MDLSPLSKAGAEIVRLAEGERGELGQAFLGVEHLFLALVQAGGAIVGGFQGRRTGKGETVFHLENLASRPWTRRGSEGNPNPEAGEGPCHGCPGRRPNRRRRSRAPSPSCRSHRRPPLRARKNAGRSQWSRSAWKPGPGAGSCRGRGIRVDLRAFCLGP